MLKGHLMALSGGKGQNFISALEHSFKNQWKALYDKNSMKLVSNFSFFVVPLNNPTSNKHFRALSPFFNFRDFTWVSQGLFLSFSFWCIFNSIFLFEIVSYCISFYKVYFDFLIRMLYHTAVSISTILDIAIIFKNNSLFSILKLLNVGEAWFILTFLSMILR